MAPSISAQTEETGAAWVVASYLPVSLFSLKSAMATASGGKTLLAPTPFAVKMALLDAAIRTRGLATGQRLFPLVRDLQVALDPPERLVVLNSFGKVRRPLELKDPSKAAQKVADARDRKAYPFQPTIAYREYVQFGGPFRLAFASGYSDSSDLAEIGALLTYINYLGKRGGFIQLAQPPQLESKLGQQFVVLTAEQVDRFGPDWTMQALDDCGARLTFERANIYTSERITLGQERILRHIPIPLHLTRSSRGYSMYERIS